MHLLGVRLLKDDGHIFKNLKKYDTEHNQNGWYPFLRYKGDNSVPPIPGSKITFDVDCSFYSINKTNITVSAIVGMNGSGKSTLLDIVYRIINNISYMIKIYKSYDGCDLSYSYGFSAELYFSINKESEEVVGCLLIDDNGNNIIHFPYYSDTNTNSYKEINLGRLDRKTGQILDKYTGNFELKDLRHLFYTIVTNYSMYSFNPEDYWGEDAYYPFGIFHKNDAYVTPIVLLPYRNEEGVIDTAGERDLARQRIIALQIFLLNESSGKKNNNLIDNRTPKEISYTFKKDYIEKKDKENGRETIVKEFYNRLIRLGITGNENNVDTSDWFNILNKEWIKKLNKLLNEQSPLTDTLSEQIPQKKLLDTLIFYLTYKTFKTCGHYGVFLDEFIICELENSFQILINKIINDDTFISLKIRQCVEFIKCINPSEYKEIDKTWTVNVTNINSKIKTVDGYFLKLPPSVFHTDLIFHEADDNNQNIRMSALSSGELQLLNTFSYVLYHLKNLEYRKSLMKDAFTKDYFPDYTNFLLIFDEAELYMHPEFQRKFIYKLLDLLKRCNFNSDRINQIHILLATHSPFILSDIPAQNILMLRDGNFCEIHNAQTFGANIFDLMRNQFFMSSPIGEIAREKINSIITYANNGVYDKDKHDQYEKTVKLIGDSYLNKTLLYMLNKIK